MMTLVPNDVILGALARERQARFLASVSTRRGRNARRPIRVSLGRMLISIGTSLSGDSREARVPHTATRQAA